MGGGDSKDLKHKGFQTTRLKARKVNLTHAGKKLGAISINQRVVL